MRVSQEPSHEVSDPALCSHKHTRARVLRHVAQEACACMHRPAHGRCITPQDRETLRRCGGVDGRANVGHMPGSCLCASVRALLPGSHVQGVHAQGGACRTSAACALGVYASKASPVAAFFKGCRLFLVLAKQLRAEEAKDETLIMRSGR